MKNKIKVVMMFILVFAGCTSYIRSIPSFPECKILKLYVNPDVVIGEEVFWVIFVNTAVDSIRIETYTKGQRNPITIQEGSFTHGISPVSNMEWAWTPPSTGYFILDFSVWNKYTKDTYTQWINVESTHSSLYGN